MVFQPFLMFSLGIEWNYHLTIIQELYYDGGKALRMANRTILKIDIHISWYQVEGLPYPFSIIVYMLGG